MNRLITGILILALGFSCAEKQKQVNNTIVKGDVFGTYFRVTYNSEVEFEKAFDSLFNAVNKSMSTYIPNSDISRLNRNEDSLIDTHFIRVFEASKIIYEATNGAFDPTIGAVVNAWDFGPEGSIVNLDSLKIDSLMLSVGLNKIKRFQNKIEKPEGTFVDFNAIAKGYAVDLLSEYLESQGVLNYLVDIGGELRAKGENMERQSLWKVGVEDPNFDGSQSINRVLELKDQAMATSGTYRKFKIDDNGNRYAHIIDTKTGYPSKTNLLSISVIAGSCMMADAYATAFKTMGIDGIKEFLELRPGLKVFLIFENENKELETLALNGFPES